MFEIIDILQEKNKKYQVVLDNQTSYYLYWTDLKALKIEKGSELDEDKIEQIESLLYKRGLNYCYHLISKKDYTSWQIQQKLTKAHYTECLIEKIEEKLKDMGIVDDEVYTEKFVNTYLETKSVKWIQSKLYEKGIKNVNIDDYIEDKESAQREAIEKAMAKWMRGKEREEIDKNKLIKHLYQKGFDYQLIKEEIIE